MPTMRGTINLTQYPMMPHRYPDGTLLRKGDLHANPLNALYFLLQEGVVKLPKEDFDQFVTCYQKFSTTAEDNLTDKERCETILEMASIIQKIEKSDSDVRVLFAGDIICDRCENDYPMLCLLRKLGELGVKRTFIDGNHDSKFIELFYRHMIDYDPEPPDHIPTKDLNSKNENKRHHAQYRSFYNFLNLAAYIEENNIDHPDIIQETQDILNQHYLPNLKVIDINLRQTPDKISVEISTHAATRFESIKTLAEALNVEYHEENRAALLETCEQINAAMRDKLWPFINATERIKDNYWINTDALLQVRGPERAPKRHPLYDFMFVRHDNHQLKENPERNHKDENFVFFHGHDKSSYYKNSLGLDDSPVGKINDPRYYQGLYYVHSSHDPILTPVQSPVLMSSPQATSSTKNTNLESSNEPSSHSSPYTHK